MMICYEVAPDDGQWSSAQSKLQFSHQNSAFTLNSEPIKAQYPIGLQRLNHYFYIYWSPAQITVVGDNNWDQFTELLTRERLASVKVPEKTTQILAMSLKKNENKIIHCGTFNTEHDCILCAHQSIVQIINSNEELLFSGKIEQFNDEQRKIRTEAGYFYFWKDMEYLEIKTNAFENIEQMKMNQQMGNQEMIPDQIVNQQRMEEQNIENQNYQNVSQQKQKQKMIDQEHQKTARKPLQRKIDEQQTLKKQSFVDFEHKQFGQKMAEQEIQDKNDDIQDQDRQEPEQSINRQQQSSFAGQSSISPMLDSNFLRHILNYNLSEYRVELCGLNGCDVIDIRTKNQKQFLYYNQFVEGNQAESRLLCELKYEQGEETQKIISTKLIYDRQSDCVYYNDTQRNLLHEFSLKQNKQSSYSIKKPIKDMTIFSNGVLLCINQNQIFKFDTNQKKFKIVISYKTVKNLSKISNIFMQFYYAIGSTDGMVRTYDIRTSRKGKALNKFKMPKEITSLQVSSKGGFILCRYGHKAQILYCKNKDQSSAFQSRIKINERKSSKNLVKGYEKLSHIQFLKESQQEEGDVIAVDDSNPCQLVLRNIQISKKLQIHSLQNSSNQINYLNCDENWVVYGIKGSYYRQLLNLD